MISKEKGNAYNICDAGDRSERKWMLQNQWVIGLGIMKDNIIRDFSKFSMASQW